MFRGTGRAAPAEPQETLSLLEALVRVSDRRTRRHGPVTGAQVIRIEKRQPNTCRQRASAAGNPFLALALAIARIFPTIILQAR